MLKEKLDALKKSRKTNELTYKPLISFINNCDYDTEVLFEQISFTTPFLEETQNFNPELLKETELSDFKKRIHKELLNSYNYINDESFDFYLEYLLRKFKLDLFAPSHFAFFLMPFEKYFGQFCILDGKSFNFFNGVSFYSIDFLKKLYKKNHLFKNNFLAFFEGIDEIEEINLFIKTVTEE